MSTTQTIFSGLSVIASSATFVCILVLIHKLDATKKELDELKAKTQRQISAVKTALMEVDS